MYLILYKNGIKFYFAQRKIAERNTDNKPRDVSSNRLVIMKQLFNHG